MHTDQGKEPPRRSARPASGWASPSPWACPAPPRTTPSSSPGTPPWSSSSGAWSTATRSRVADWIETYNTVRRHSAPGMRSPVAYEHALTAGEAAWHAQTQARHARSGQPCAPAVTWQLIGTGKREISSIQSVHTSRGNADDIRSEYWSIISNTMRPRCLRRNNEDIT